MALTERKLEIVAWDKPGTTVEGRLLQANKVKYDDGVGMKYIVRSRAGSIVAFKGATQLDMCLHSGDIGKIVQVEYRGLDSSREAKPGFSQPKVFIVCVDDQSLVKAGDDSITDDDIPF